MSDWRIRHEDADGRDAQSTRRCKEDAIVQAIYLERAGSPRPCAVCRGDRARQARGKPARVIIEANSEDRLPRKLGAAFGRPFFIWAYRGSSTVMTIRLNRAHGGRVSFHCAIESPGAFQKRVNLHADHRFNLGINTVIHVTDRGSHCAYDGCNVNSKILGL
jgi:hypothetical protein